VRCAEHGVHLAEVAWARPGSGFTMLFEAMLTYAKQMPIAPLARLAREHDSEGKTPGRLRHRRRHPDAAAHLAVEGGHVRGDGESLVSTGGRALVLLDANPVPPAAPPSAPSPTGRVQVGIDAAITANHHMAVAALGRQDGHDDAAGGLCPACSPSPSRRR
jgi:hypothetical protein